MTTVPSRRALHALAQILPVRRGQYLCFACLTSQRSRARNVIRPAALGLRSIWTSRTSLAAAVEEEHEDCAKKHIEYQLHVPGIVDNELLDEPIDVDSELNYEETSNPNPCMLDDFNILEAGLEHSRKRIAVLEDALIDALEKRQENQIRDSSIEGIDSSYLRTQDLAGSTASCESNEAHSDPEKKEQSVLCPIEETSKAYADSMINMIPWYLRPQETDALIPKIDIQKVTQEQYPDLPRNSPPILQPLVSRLFYDHHLQNILILDLRNRWPPPAWGSETIMVLATARSERQLGSVAEATGKWLKQTVGAIPRIDGLPKKETLVLKRRRLRRKAMLKPGYMAPPPRPTTWVSVNTGYQGIVLQLFTEEGRIEYDLEGLWGDARVVDAEELDMKPRTITPGGFEETEIVETWRPVSQKKSEAEKKEEKARKKLETRLEKRAAKRRWTKAEKEEARQIRLREQAFSAPGNKWPRSNTQSSGWDRRITDQRRQFHTSRPVFAGRYVAGEMLTDFKTSDYSRLKVARPGDISCTKTSWWKKPKLLPEISDLRLPDEVYEQFLDALRAQPPFAERDDATDLLARTIAIQGSRYQADKLANVYASKDPDSLRLLTHFGMLACFTKLFREADEKERHELLRNFRMEPFPEMGFKWALDFFIRDLPIRPTAHHYHLALMYYLNLSRIAPQNYPPIRILDIMLLVTSQGMHVPRSTFHLILNHIATKRPFPPDGSDSASNADLRVQLKERLHNMTTIIKRMKVDFGLEYLRDEEIYLALYRASCDPFPTIPDLIRDITLPLPLHAFEFSEMAVRFFADKYIPKSPEFFMLELMSFAHRRRWRSFVKRWLWLVKFGVTRDADLWTVFWGCLARGQHEYDIRLALTNQFPEMMDEGEGLKMNREIGIALKRCLELVDPENLEFEMQKKVTGRILETFPQ